MIAYFILVLHVLLIAGVGLLVIFFQAIINYSFIPIPIIMDLDVPHIIFHHIINHVLQRTVLYRHHHTRHQHCKGNGTHHDIAATFIAPYIAPGQFYKLIYHYIDSRIAFTGLSFPITISGYNPRIIAIKNIAQAWKKNNDGSTEKKYAGSTSKVSKALADSPLKNIG